MINTSMQNTTMNTSLNSTMLHGPSARLRATDIIAKDKHGFTSEEVSLYGAFTMEDVTFRDAPPESMY